MEATAQSSPDNCQPGACATPMETSCEPAACIGKDLCEQVWGVWQEHAATLRRFLQQRTREQALTDDLLSEVLLKAYKSCEKLAEAKNVQAWLTRVAQNALTDHYRQRKLVDLPAAEVLDATPAEGLLPEQRLASCLGELLGLLPEADRLPLQWADLEGVPQEEVARRLGMSLSGAKSRIQRARVKLRQHIEACCAVETDQLGRITDYHSKGSC